METFDFVVVVVVADVVDDVVVVVVVVVRLADTNVPSSVAALKMELKLNRERGSKTQQLVALQNQKWSNKRDGNGCARAIPTQPTWSESR